MERSSPNQRHLTTATAACFAVRHGGVVYRSTEEPSCTIRLGCYLKVPSQLVGTEDNFAAETTRVVVRAH